VQSGQPFPETLRAILDEQEVSLRELARRCQERNGWGSSAAVSQMMLGHMAASMHAMREIAAALSIRPETFAEYRLGVAREMLEPDAAGSLKKALANLELFTGQQPADGEPEEHRPSTRPGRGGRAGRAAST